MTSGRLVAPTLVTPRGNRPARGAAMGDLCTLSPGAIAWEDGRITFVGAPEDLPAGPPPEILGGATLAPGFVDAHTHLPFVGWRADEFEARLAGATYRDQAGAGGGIPRSARMLAAADDDAVLAFCAPLVEAMATDVPILAYSAAAVPETLGGAGVQFAPKDMEYAAELLGVLTFDDSLRAEVIAGQRRRLADFSDARIERALSSVLAYSGGSYPS